MDQRNENRTLPIRLRRGLFRVACLRLAAVVAFVGSPAHALAAPPVAPGSAPQVPPGAAADAERVSGEEAEVEEAPPAPDHLVDAAPESESEAAVESGAGRLEMTLVAETAMRKDRVSGAPPKAGDEEMPRFMHGFRLGYLYLANHDRPVDADDPDSSLERKYEVRNPHQFLLGYEATQRIPGTSWLNVLLLGNIMISGLEQSKVFPAANLMLGFEFKRSFQTGVGINLLPIKEKAAHMIVAAGWTPTAGDLYLPLHFFFIPDVDGNHRAGVTVGVNWES
ncbi:MAG: hypothetical protein OEZ06_10035 [Myxococcales bacterium]|nr:hypothetical protein [Myxococcales bacterium]